MDYIEEYVRKAKKYIFVYPVCEFIYTILMACIVFLNIKNIISKEAATALLVPVGAWIIITSIKI